MSGASGLAAARRRRGNPPTTPQRMVQQQQPSPNNSQQQVPGTPTGPQTPMTILHQHHIKLEEHDKVFEEIATKLELLQDLPIPNPPLSSQVEMELHPSTIEHIKLSMIDPLENDLQSVLSGYQLKIDMLSSTLNSQQNYILELNTTLLGVVNQMTKLLAIKEQNISSSPLSSSSHRTSSSSVHPVTEKRMNTEYFASEPPEPFDSGATPVATFGYGDNGFPPSSEKNELFLGSTMKIDVGANDDDVNAKEDDVNANEDTRNIMDVDDSVPCPNTDLSDHPSGDMSVD